MGHLVSLECGRMPVPREIVPSERTVCDPIRLRHLNRRPNDSCLAFEHRDADSVLACGYLTRLFWLKRLLSLA